VSELGDHHQHAWLGLVVEGEVHRELLRRRGELRREIVDVERAVGRESGTEEQDLAHVVVELVMLDDVEVVMEQKARDALHDAETFRTGQGQDAERPGVTRCRRRASRQR
jgi:hypothetical protein